MGRRWGKQINNRDDDCGHSDLASSSHAPSLVLSELVTGEVDFLANHKQIPFAQVLPKFCPRIRLNSPFLERIIKV